MKQLVLSSLTVALAAVCTLANAAPRVTYDIQQVSDEQEGVSAFNNDGVITYSAYVLPDFDFHTFVWKNGTVVDISADIDPNAYYVDVSGLNDRGDMVGMHSGDTIASFLYHNGQVTPIEPFPGDTIVYVHDINNRGQVVGDSTASGEQSTAVFVWDRGQVRVLSPLPGSTGATARAINDCGVAVGRDYAGVGVLWRGQNAEAIPLPAGADSSDAIDINDRNEVILNASVNAARRSLYSHNGHTRVLPLLNDTQNGSYVMDINEWGIVAGTTYADSGYAVATLWQGNQAVDLNTLLSDTIPAEARPQLTEARFINDKGQIVAEGPSGTFLLTPHRD
jgi:uncharacterized membrane protein